MDVFDFFKDMDLSNHAPVKLKCGTITNFPTFVNVNLARARGKAGKEKTAAIDRLTELKDILCQ